MVTFVTRKHIFVTRKLSGEATRYTVCVCVCFFFSPAILDVRLVDVPAGVTQEESHTGFLTHLSSAVFALNFIARRIQPLLSLVDCEIEFCVLTI